MVKDNFGSVLMDIDSKATEIFRNYEKQALLTLAKEWVKEQKETLN